MYTNRLLEILGLCVVLFFVGSSFGGSGKVVLISDDFGTESGQWQIVSLDEAETLEYFKIQDKHLTLQNNGNSRNGAYHSQPIEGHFLIEASFEADDNIGLALIQEKDGEPDIENFTMLCVDTNEDGVVEVSVKDRQNGKDNVLDNTGRHERRISRGRYKNDTYQHTLTGQVYSVPFDKTNKKIQIFRDGPAGFFHYYYAVKKVIRGKEASGWMEIVPSKDWAKPGQKYYVALISNSKGKSVYTNVTAVQKPTQDQDDRETGFRAVRRDYSWSGQLGEAVVVSFDEAFDFHDDDMKFVFWTEMNYVPAWHLNNQLLFTYEFMETWGGGVRGCNEPMSDRILRWSRVDILEDNPVRKVVHWHYVLCNPDYQVPDDDKGTQVPEADEYWTFYPDGSGIRYMEYRPKLDTDYRSRHELAELISIAGTLTDSDEHYDSPALTLTNLEGEVIDTHPGPKFDYGSPVDDWHQMILAPHFKGLPDPFYVFSFDPAVRETWSGYKVRHELAWQNIHGRLVHWPGGKRPYTGNNGSGGSWKGEVSHACLISCGVIEGESWEDHYKVDADGRKYRSWACLVGLQDSNEYVEMREKAKSWLFPGKVVRSDGLAFSKIDYRHKAITFEQKAVQKSYQFSIDSTAHESLLMNPVIVIEKWTHHNIKEIKINGQDFDEERYRATVENDALLLWLNVNNATLLTVEIKVEL